LFISDFNSNCFTELNGGSNFVTDRFFEKSGFSFVIIGANRKTKISKTRKAREKFSLPVMYRIFFLINIVAGIIKRNRRVDIAASIKLKFKTAIAEEVSLTNNPM
jgi:hypothetical protein